MHTPPQEGRALGVATEQNKSQTVTIVGERDSTLSFGKKKRERTKRLGALLWQRLWSPRRAGVGAPLRRPWPWPRRGPPARAQQLPGSMCRHDHEAQKRGRAPWLSNSDQASLSSMKTIRACCS